MAIITISRQVAALGDEIASYTAEKLGYRFAGRKQIEQRIVELGFNKDKLLKYDERKPGFFASLAKDRDEYLDYLQTAVLEAVQDNNCIIIGRGASIILNDLPNLISLRFVSDDNVRRERLKNEFSWNDKQADKRIAESDTNRAGFHKSFFNIENEDPSMFDLTVNTGKLTIESVAALIESLVKTSVTQSDEDSGQKRVKELLLCQSVVNLMIFKHKLNINFLKAQIDNKTVTLQGIADSHAVVDTAVTIAQAHLKDYEVVSAINIVQDYKAFQQ